MPIHKTCPQSKLAKCERCAIETLISKSAFVSNSAGDIIFCNERSYRRAADSKHFTSDLLTHANRYTELFPEEENFLNASGALHEL